ncbi:MAG: chromosomal replication initiator protein DnaA [Thermoflexales bacterium]|nr:chromosomal replication initiator protein DnaA [Thermoflexales bacterium]MDW8350963.1 chromosomal replication initiator protein DnaA [Anaerolineae bacterium]
MKAEEAWRSVLGEIEIGMGRSSYVTWLKSARLLTYEDGQFVIGVANGYAKEWIEQRKLSDIRRMLSERMGRSVDVSLVVMTHNAGQPTTDALRRLETPPSAATSAQPARPSLGYANDTTSDGLQKRYTFAAFVVGSGNRMAHAAAMAVAEAPAERYNPLFLYGGSGLGKTHLLHAIGNHAKQRGLVCRYVTSETFTNELISAIRSQSQEAFRNRYRYVDMLLMDDVQFIAGKESTQEEFFHTFNALHGANKQIVLTSDRAPKMMVTLEDRLRSRFEWGLMVDIAPPDLETRMAILQHKVAQMGCTIPADVIEFVAKQIQSNVRELEGALTRLLATSEMTGRPITIQFARDTLADLVGRRAHITPSQVIETVAKYYNISVADMVSPSRNKELVQPRQIAMYLIRQETDASLPEIGSLLGGRDHTTILHGVERIKDRLETEEQLRRDVMSVREQLYLNVTT